jgi:2-aminobenzoate-CoA ligase
VNNRELVYSDHFIQKNSPDEKDLPDLINLDKFNLPERINCVTELLDNAITEGYGDKIAVITANQSYTYQELLDKSNQVANYLMNDLGVIPGNRVLLHSPNNFMMAASWLGIVKAGAVTVAILPTLEPERIVKVIHKAEIKVALCDDRFAKRFALVQQMTNMLTHVAAFDADLSTHSKLNSQSTVFNNVDTAADECCLIGFTSGTTTGNPKAVIHLHRDILIVCQAAGEHAYKITEQDILIGSPSLAFGYGLGSLLLSALYCRASTVLLESPTPVELLERIKRHRPTLLFTSPQAYQAMEAHCDNYDISSLRFCAASGEHIMPSIWHSWKRKTNISIFHGIGSTEMLFLFLGPDIDDIKPGRIGKPIFGYEAKVVDSQGNELPANAIGLLAVRGPLGCRYLSDERQTKYVIKGWNVTDDCVLRDEEGYYWFHGRAENEVTTDSGRLNLLELENALSTHETVAECAVVKAHTKHAITAFITLEKHVDFDKTVLEATLKEHIKMTMGDQNCPESIKFIDAFPRTASGKIQRHKLQD